MGEKEVNEVNFENSLDYNNLLRLSGSVLSRKSDNSTKQKIMRINMNMQNSQILKPDIIYKLYWEEKKSLPEIGKIFSVHHEKVRRLMIKYNIPLRSRLESQNMRKKLKVSKSELYELYWKKEMKLRDIAKLFDVSSHAVFREFNKYKIPRRTYSEAKAIQRRKISSEELKRLYIKEKKSLRELGGYVKTRPTTIKRMLTELGVHLREPGEAILKHERKSFSEDMVEKFYLIGLRVGDLHARKDSRNIVVSVSSTHPSMIELMHKLFSKYGNYYKMVHKTRFGYEWSIKYILDSSFEFLLDKTQVKIPTQRELFLSFLAGYADAEGCWKTTRGSKGHIEFRFELESQDLKILEQIYSTLIKLGFTPRFYLTRRKGSKTGTFIFRKNVYRVSLLKRAEVIRLAQTLLPFIRHREKIEKVKLLLKVSGKKNYEEIKEQVAAFKSEIKMEVMSCMNSAEIEINRIYAEKGLEHAIR